VLRYTLNGDATLDGSVGFADLLALAENYGNAASNKWTAGDFNYDGATGFADLLALAENYGTSSVTGSFASDWALAQSLVPEPTSVLGVALAGTMLRRRRV
jgi:hypothetical protein